MQARRLRERLPSINAFFAETARWKRCVPRGLPHEIDMLTTLKTKLRALLRKSEVERELDEELRYHIEQQVEQNIRLGMNPEEARQAAFKSFGGVEQAKEWSRDARGVVISHRLWQRRFGSDQKIIGRTISLNYEPYTVV